MSYTELLDRFWDMDREFSDKEKILYFYLLHRCNELGWPDIFSLSNEEIVGALKCRPTIMKEARKALVNAGLIVFSAGNGRGNNSFFSIVAEKGRFRNPFIEKGSVSEPLYEEEKGRNGNPFILSDSSKSDNNEFEDNKKGSVSEPLYAQIKTEEKKQTKKSPLPAPTSKEKNKEKKKENTHPSSGAHTHTCVQTEIVFKDLKPEPLKKKREPREPVLPKDMQEVLSFFETNGRELHDWKAEAEAFFYHFDSVGWMGTSNRKIIDWKSRAHLWIADKTVKEKQQALRTNGTTTNQSGSTRESRLNETVDLIGELLSENTIGG